MPQGITRSLPGNASGHHPVPAGECLRASPGPCCGMPQGITRSLPGNAPGHHPVPARDGSKSFFASPSQVTSHFLASPNQVTSHFRASPRLSQVTSHLVRCQVKSCHKSFGPNTSQVTSLFVQIQVKSHIISSTPVIRRGI